MKTILHNQLNLETAVDRSIEDITTWFQSGLVHSNPSSYGFQVECFEKK